MTKSEQKKILHDVWPAVTKSKVVLLGAIKEASKAKVFEFDKFSEKSTICKCK